MENKKGRKHGGICEESKSCFPASEQLVPLADRK